MIENSTIGNLLCLIPKIVIPLTVLAFQIFGIVITGSGPLTGSFVLSIFEGIGTYFDATISFFFVP